MGGLVGRFGQFTDVDKNLIVQNVQIQGVINGTYSGGMSGYIEALSVNIENSRFTGDLPDGGNGSVGGLVGISMADSLTIKESFAKADVTAWTGSAGGLIGQSQSNVSLTDSYAVGNISTTDAASGLAGGLIANHSVGVANVQSSYFSGSVSSNNLKGCIVGRNFATLTLTDIYYDSTKCTVNAVNSGAYAGATGLNTGNLQTATPFNNWSSLLWIFNLGQNPKLHWEP